MIGKTISHYKIIEKLGEGGMGEVYLAEDIKLDRKVAIKFLPKHLTKDKENVERFKREARAAASLNHPNIITIHDVIEENDQICIVMEYIEGKSLRDVIKESPQFPIPNYIDIITQISEGLSQAHQTGIVHRDIKPENIIIDKDGRVKILDFGLAKLKGVSKLTKDSSTLGTIHYMSPEQIQGQNVDHRSDIWSVGVILYELLTGEPPFIGEYESAVVYSIVNDTPEPVAGLRTGGPMELERIINKCLQKSPGDRHQHLDELVVDLKGLKRESGGILTEETQKRRFKSALIPISIVSLIILIVIGYFIIRPDERHTTEWENSIAVLPFHNISDDPEQDYFADGMTEQIISNLAKLQKLKVISRTSVMHFKGTDKTIPEIGNELQVAFVLEGSVRKFGDRIRVTAQLVNTSDDHYIWTENFDRNYIELFDIQDEVSESIAVNLLASLSKKDIAEIKTIRPRSTEAYEYFLKGRYFHYFKYWGATLHTTDFQISEQMFLKAIDLDPTFALSYANLADLYNTYSRTSSLNESDYQYYLQRQQIFLDRALELDSNLVEVQITKSWILQEKEKISNAFKSIRKALQLDPNNAYANATMGRFLHSRGLIELAHRYFEKAIETDPLQPMHYAWNGYCLTIQGDYQASENNLRQALQYDENHFVTVINYIFLLITSARYDQAKMMVAKYDQMYGKYEYMMALKAMLHALDGKKESALKSCPEGHDYNYFIYSALQMNDEAIDYLNNLFRNRWAKVEESRYIELNKNPLLENLRSDPRFQEIVAKHKKLYEKNLAKYGDIDI